MEEEWRENWRLLSHHLMVYLIEIMVRRDHMADVLHDNSRYYFQRDRIGAPKAINSQFVNSIFPPQLVHVLRFCKELAYSHTVDKYLYIYFHFDLTWDRSPILVSKALLCSPTGFSSVNISFFFMQNSQRPPKVINFKLSENPSTVGRKNIVNDQININW